MKDMQNFGSDTKSVLVSRALTRDIFEGRYKMGQPLIRRDLVKRYGASLSIVNEALGRLALDGLVEIPSRDSARVVAFTETEKRGNFLLREAVECQTARILAEEATDETLASLLSDARAFDSWLLAFGPESSMHLEFHLKLARATGYSSLEGILKRLGVRELLTSKWLENHAILHPPDFHEMLVRVFLGRDPDLAEAAMRSHLRFGQSSSSKSVAN